MSDFTIYIKFVLQETSKQVFFQVGEFKKKDSNSILLNGYKIKLF